MSTIHEKLKGKLGARYITGNAGEVSKFFKKAVSSPKLAVAYPKTHDEVSDIVKTANDTGTPIFSNYSKHLPAEISDKAGIIIDMKEMKQVERLDAKNLTAHIQCGITFDEFKVELKKHNRKIQMPAAYKNDSVVKNCVAKSVIKSQAKYPDAQISNMFVNLADGRLHKSGSHALNEMNSDTNDGATFISKWYIGSCDIFGVISRGSVMIYPIWEKRDLLAFDFDNVNSLLQAMRNIPRTEIGIEYLGMDDVYLKAITGRQGAKYTMAVGFDGAANYVDWQEKMVRQFASEHGGKENKAVSEAVLAKIDDPWPAQGACGTEFTTTYKKAPEMDAIIVGEAGKAKVGAGEIGRLFVSMDRGRGISCIYGFFKDGNDVEKMVDDLNIKLLDNGAVFESPEGDFSKLIFDKIPGYSKMLGRIKNMMDPKGILNPGIMKF
jgi:FAD/FMN-containing dehydrogenase